ASATMREAQLLVQVTHSNVKAVVESHQYLFETLWNKAIPAEQKIKEIEEGLDPVRIEVVYDSSRTKNLYVKMIENACSEIMVLFPTANGFIRQEKAGIIQLLRQAVEEHHIKVRILMPAHSSMLIPQHSQINPKDDSLPGDHDLDSFLSIRHIQPLVDSAQISSILVTDKKHSLVVELKDDANMIFEEAIGLSTYSNSKPGVLSYVAIFENLWLVTELYEHIRNVNEELQKANEHLKINDKMQKEFINIAAHELRTPTQAILSFADLLPLYPDNKDLGIMIQRNAKRLQRLIKDILDVTKIESQQLILRKGTVNIHDLSYLVQDYGQQLEKLNTTKIIKLFSQFPEEKNVFLIADKERLLEVISNIMDNAIKFIEKEGSIYFHVKVEGTENNDDNDLASGNHVLITIKDTGIGISEEIFPRLFTRFASKSINGTGLGLYISKSIIEAHGGKIWAENNKNGNGATFTIRLPLNTNNKINYKQNERREGEDE
ncbi:MAG TPA: HAMP domain-containing sensor histidine kinase, partial [Phototrophicaceae bacterium]|nr:HAMP domain-containing sensor histidine kinase [Phototrophicaceae bacterium]